MAKKDVIIGIDLGTTNSAVSVVLLPSEFVITIGSPASTTEQCWEDQFALYGALMGIFTALFVLLCSYFGYHLIYKSPIAHREKK